VGPARAAAILYGDWGTSKTYVLGIAFALAGYSSFPLLAAMGMLTALVGLNYYWICSNYPDGGGVYSSVRERSRLVATIGALLLIADYLVTASLSVLEGFNYIALMIESHFHVILPHPHLWAIGLIAFLGILNGWGPRHSGSFAILLGIPASFVAISLALLAIPHLGQAHFKPSGLSFGNQWMLFAGMILALSGVEAVSNMTGVMAPDPKLSKTGEVTVKRTSAWAIGIVAIEVVALTIVLAWAMHAVPGLDQGRTDAMLGQMADYFGRHAFGNTLGPVYATLVGIPLALLLFSAGNTALIGMISVLHMMARDREMPAPFGKLNRHGVPFLPLIVATVLPCAILLLVQKVQGLAALYAIGVVGAITINIGGCATNKRLPLKAGVRVVMALTAVVMGAIWLTVAAEKHDALIFAITVLASGLLARSFVQERREVREAEEMRELLAGDLKEDGASDVPRILVALRGVTETLRFAVEETELRKGRLAVLFVREVKVMIPVEPDIREDAEALKILQAVRATVGEVPFQFVYRVSDNAPHTIQQVAREYRADYLVLGASAQGAITKLLRGSVVTTIAQNLPPGTRLLIYSWHSRK
jgi:amino acid transporter